MKSTACRVPARPNRWQSLETDIDDMSPQVYEYTTNKMFDPGAFGVFWNPVPMKKNRAGTLIAVICKPDLAVMFAEAHLRESTSKGLRWRLR